MALAQKPRILLLDEPTTFLDIHHQFEIMELLQRIEEGLDITVIMVIHDLNHAARFSHRVIALKHGRVIKDGYPHEVITEDILRDVFGVKAKVMVMAFKDHHNRDFTLCFPCGVCK